MKGTARTCGILSFSFLSFLPSVIQAEPNFLCAGYEPPENHAGTAAKTISNSHRALPSHGTINAVVIFAQFADEAHKGEGIPGYAGDLLDLDHPGSFAHFYDTMSFGQLRVRGSGSAGRVPHFGQRLSAPTHPARPGAGRGQPVPGRPDPGLAAHLPLQADPESGFEVNSISVCFL